MSGVAVSVDYELRAAQPSDNAAVQALLGECGLPVAGLEQAWPDGYAVAIAENTIVGVGGVESYGASGLLRSVAVAPPWRGRGVGEALVHDRLAWAQARGMESMHLLTTTAAPFFARLGFSVVERGAVPAAVRASREFVEVCPASATVMALPVAEWLRATVRTKYAVAARAASGQQRASCGGASGCGCGCGTADNPITADLYGAAETSDLPAEALLASLGCGNPTALATLHAGEHVLDLGSGGGIDVLLAARRVGPTGRVYGLDMTPEMHELARANQARAGVTNAEFLLGTIESIPLPDATVDVIMSNCVINLSADKARVLREAYRVLRPGGRFAVSDIVLRQALPEALRRSTELWTGCVAGALTETAYRTLLADAGFTDIDLEPTRVYTAADAAALTEGAGVDNALAEAAAGCVMSAFVRARKPA